MSVPKNEMILGHYHAYHDNVISKYQDIQNYSVNVSKEIMDKLQCEFTCVIETKELHLHNKGLHDADMQWILESLESAAVTFSKLDISQNEDLTDQTAEYITAFHLARETCCRLNIHGTQITSNGRDTLREVVTHLQFQHEGISAPYSSKKVPQNAKPKFIPFS